MTLHLISCSRVGGYSSTEARELATLVERGNLQIKKLEYDRRLNARGDAWEDAYRSVNTSPREHALIVAALRAFA